MKYTQKSFYISFSQHFCSLLEKILIICHYLFNKHIEPCDIYWGSLFLKYPLFISFLYYNYSKDI